MLELVICTNNHENCCFEGYFKNEQDALERVREIVLERLSEIYGDSEIVSASEMSLEKLDDIYNWESNGIINYNLRHGMVGNKK